MTNSNHSAPTFCGYVTLTGKPNAGKSTLLNNLIQKNIAITSRKSQTTRFSIQGIHTKDNKQIVFIDTPGLFKPQSDFEKNIYKEIYLGLDSTDIVLFMVDCLTLRKESDFLNLGLKEVLNYMKDTPPKVFIILNKVDKIKKETLLNQINKLYELYQPDEIIPLSALNDKDGEWLMNSLYKYLPEGPFMYPSTMQYDMDEGLLFAEFTREIIFDIIHDELPYHLGVTNYTLKTLNNGNLRIEQIIWIKRDDLKKIILGKKGEMIKQIGMMSKEKIEAFTGKKVDLFLTVQNKTNWNNNKDILREMGFSVD